MLGIFLDTETNGLNPQKHHILEIAYQIIDLETGGSQLHFQSNVKCTEEHWNKSDPESLKINGFSWEELSFGKSKDDIKELILSHFKQLNIRRGKSVFICQNPSFDRAFFSQIIDPDLQESLQWPYHWLDLASMYWVRGLQLGKEHHAYLPWETGISKDQIATALNLQPESKPHRAMNGVEHLLFCYQKIVGFPKSAVDLPLQLTL